VRSICCFVDISGIVDQHWLNFLFITEYAIWNRHENVFIHVVVARNKL